MKQSEWKTTTTTTVQFSEMDTKERMNHNKVRMQTTPYAKKTRKDGANIKALNLQLLEDRSYRLVITGKEDANKQGRNLQCPSPGPMGEIKKTSFSNLD